MNLGLEGQTVAVVGAARGIGRAIAERFAAEKANVGLIDVQPNVVAVAAEIAVQEQVHAASALADVTRYEQLCQAAALVRQQLGRIHHVVFAVAVGSGKFGFPYWNLEPSDWERVLRVNVLGAVNMAHAFVADLRQDPAGTMLFIASVSGQIGSQTDPPYSASKAALINFAQCAAKDLAPFGVRVNTVCPGMVKTELNRSIWEAWARQQPPEQRQDYEEWSAEKIKRVVPLGRWQEADDIARMVVFLTSPCARNVTGQTINVDGGFVMHW